MTAVSTQAGAPFNKIIGGLYKKTNVLNMSPWGILKGSAGSVYKPILDGKRNSFLI